MANIKSAEKRNRQAKKRRVRNVETKKAIKAARRDVFAAEATKDKAALEKEFKAYCSVLDKSVKRGIIHKNNAIRRKARAAAKLRKLTAAV